MMKTWSMTQVFWLEHVKTGKGLGSGADQDLKLFSAYPFPDFFWENELLVQLKINLN